MSLKKCSTTNLVPEKSVTQVTVLKKYPTTDIWQGIPSLLNDFKCPKEGC